MLKPGSRLAHTQSRCQQARPGARPGTPNGGDTPSHPSSQKGAIVVDGACHVPEQGLARVLPLASARSRLLSPSSPPSTRAEMSRSSAMHSDTPSLSTKSATLADDCRELIRSCCIVQTVTKE